MKLNIGLIGHGYWGKNILRNLKNFTNFNKIYCLDKDKYQNSKNIFFFINETLFFKKQIDLFIITTPTNTHLKFIEKCLKLNKYVCITKPVFKNLKELNYIEKKYKNLNKIFADHTYIYHPSITYIKQLIKKKSLGKIIYFDSERISFGKFYEDNDVIDDLAIHDFYLLDYFFPDHKFNFSNKAISKNFGKKIYFSNVSLRSKKNLFVNIKVNWFSPFKSRKIIIAGEKKTIVFDDSLSDEKIKIYKKGIKMKNFNKKKIWEYRIGSIETPYVSPKESLNVMLQNFFKFSSGGKVPTNFNHIKKVFKLHDLVKK